MLKFEAIMLSCSLAGCINSENVVRYAVRNKGNNKKTYDYEKDSFNHSLHSVLCADD